MAPLLQTGRDVIAAMIIGEATTDYTNALAFIFVGTSCTAHAATQTYLQGATTSKSSQEATYTSRATNVLTFRSVFGTCQANWDWNEWAIKNSSVSSTGTGAMLNRMVEALGVKACTQSWQITATATITT